MESRIKKISKENLLGSGEFSDAYKIDDLIIKKNRKKSLHNPDFFKNFEVKSINEMKGEIKAFNLLKEGKFSILPKNMKGKKYQDNYYITREFGEIPVKKEDKRKFLPKWKKGKVTKKSYNKFIKELYEIAAKYGVFEDIIQPAIRKDGSLFISDLGHFTTKENYEIGYGSKSKDEETQKYNCYEQLIENLEKLDQQMGIKHEIPTKVLRFLIKYNKKRAKTSVLSKFYIEQKEEYEKLLKKQTRK